MPTIDCSARQTDLVDVYHFTGRRYERGQVVPFVIATRLNFARSLVLLGSSSWAGLLSCLLLICC